MGKAIASAFRCGLPRPIPSSGFSLASADSLVIERKALAMLRRSARVIQTLLAPRRASTQKVYSSIWSRSSGWCQEHGADLRKLEISAILDILQEGLDKGLQSSTTAHQVSAFRSIFFMGSAGSLAENPQTSRFLRAVRPVFPKWDLPQVLKPVIDHPFKPLISVSIKIYFFFYRYRIC